MARKVRGRTTIKRHPVPSEALYHQLDADVAELRATVHKIGQLAAANLRRCGELQRKIDDLNRDQRPAPRLTHDGDDAFPLRPVSS